MNKITQALLATSCAAVVAVATPASAATTVTFGNTAIANGASVTTQYSASGVIASNAIQYVDNRDTFDGRGLTGTANPLTITFTSLVSGLSMDYVEIGGSTFTASLFGAGGNLLETFTNATLRDLNATHAFAATNIKSLQLLALPVQFTGISTLRFTAAVPEPATWAMMLVGFGMMGASMRYRRRSTTTVYA